MVANSIELQNIFVVYIFVKITKAKKVDAKERLEKRKFSALIVYASLTGNTEEIAHVLGATFEKMKIDAKIVECTQASARDFLDYELCIVGTYTYGREGELPDEINSFYEELAEVDLTGKVYGALGSGEEAYGYYCKSADDFDQQFETTGAFKGAEVVKVELDPEKEDVENIVAFAKSMVRSYEMSKLEA